MTETLTLDATADEATTDAQVTSLVIPDVATRQLPWAGITAGSAGDDELLTSAEMAERAKLNWTVAKRPYRRDCPGSPQARQHEIYRVEDNEELGSVRARYQVYQNADAFAFGDSLVQDGRARWADAGQQGNGWRVFMVMQLIEPFTVLDDEIRLYLFMQTSHDGSSAVRGFVTPIKFFCTNQMEAIRNTALSRFTFQHTTNLQQRLDEARLSFQTAVSYETAFTEMAEALVKVPVTADRLRLVLQDTVPQRRGRRDGVIEDVLHTYATSPTVEPWRGNAWGAVNAVTEYFDHVIPSRTGNARFERIMMAEGARMRNNVTAKLLALA